MHIPRPSDDDRARFRAAVPDDPRVEVKPMFGNLGAFVNGNMFMGLFGSDIGVKLSPADMQALATVDGTAPFGPSERPMGGYLTLPAALIGTDAGADWIARSLAYVGAMPPKPPKG